MINKRSIIGTLLFLILVGEPMVGFKSGLYTIPGLIVFPILYFLLFELYEALAIKYRLTYFSLLPLTFGIYSVLVTGLLHGELGDYINAPQNNLGTTLIRIQCSFFTIFAYYLINKLTKRDPRKIPKIRNILLASLVFALILTPSKSIGFIKLIETFKLAPLLAILFSIMAFIGIIFALNVNSSKTSIFKSKVLDFISIAFVILCLIPSFQLFIFILFIMPAIGIFYLLNHDFRNTLI